MINFRLFSPHYKKTKEITSRKVKRHKYRFWFGLNRTYNFSKLNFFSITPLRLSAFPFLTKKAQFKILHKLSSVFGKTSEVRLGLNERWFRFVLGKTEFSLYEQASLLKTFYNTTSKRVSKKSLFYSFRKKSSKDFFFIPKRNHFSRFVQILVAQFIGYSK
jgi:hypothetical protein